MARAFSFRLDQVLNYRRQLEDLSIRRMADARAERARIQLDLAERQGQKDELRDWFSGEERQGAFAVEEANAYNDYLDFLSGQEKSLKRKGRDAEVEVEKRRVEAVEAAKKRRLLEGLREKRLSAHEAQVAKEDQAFLDDISSIAFIRRDRASRVRRAFEL